MKRTLSIILCSLIFFSCSKKNDIINVDLVEKDTLTTGWQIKKVENDLDFWDMHFSSAQTGIAILRKGSSSQFENLVYKTIDGGNSWSRQDSLVRYYSQFDTATKAYRFSFEKCTMKNDGVSFILGSGSAASVLYKTMDFKTFDSTNFPAELYSISFINNSTGYCSGFKQELGQKKVALYKTTNGGLNWNELTITNIPRPNVSPIFFSAYFIDNSTGWFAFNSVYNSQSNDITWLQTQTQISNGLLTSISAPSKNTVYIGGTAGGVFKSTNGGLGFIKLKLPFDFPNTFVDVQFVNEQVGYFVATNKVLKTADGGLTWKTEVSLKDGRVFELNVINENTCFVGGRNGMFLKLSR